MRLVEPAPVANLVWFDALSSTNDVADRIMASFLEEEDPTLPHTVIVAGEQTGGHGRGANSWVSPRGGLYATWLGWLPTEVLAAVPMAAGLACARAIESVVPALEVGFKWPNDLFVEGCKLGGVLCHSRAGSEAAWVQVGFGINVAVVPSLGPDDPVRPTSLAEHGWAGDALGTGLRLVGEFVREFPQALDGGATLRDDWMARSVHAAGDRLTLRLDGTAVEGRFLGFAPDGSLRLDVGSEVRQFSSGELVLPLAPRGGK